jgi:hypothetical protein
VWWRCIMLVEILDGRLVRLELNEVMVVLVIGMVCVLIGWCVWMNEVRKEV